VSLTFNAETHRYRMDKKHVSGVTTILGKAHPEGRPQVLGGPKDRRQYVAEHEDDVAALRAMGGQKLAAVLKQVPWDKRDDAGRGTDIHEVAERHRPRRGGRRPRATRRPTWTTSCGSSTPGRSSRS
jgi:hypothetical protein